MRDLALMPAMSLVCADASDAEEVHDVDSTPMTACNWAASAASVSAATCSRGVLCML